MPVFARRNFGDGGCAEPMYPSIVASRLLNMQPIVEHMTAAPGSPQTPNPYTLFYPSFMCHGLRFHAAECSRG